MPTAHEWKTIFVRDLQVISGYSSLENDHRGISPTIDLSGQCSNRSTFAP